MILLIQELQEKYDLLDENLNSIMILLIRNSDRDAFSTPYWFKFHYDSINSRLQLCLIRRSKNLNSIMILLILKRLMQGSLLCLGNLNSIMILLIHRRAVRNEVEDQKFKFHYDSINSIIGLSLPSINFKFKFHYDSINSRRYRTGWRL